MATYTKKELEALTTIYDTFAPRIQEFVKRGKITMNVIKREMSKFGDSNMEVLQSEFIGKQVLFNEKTQKAILDTLGITEKEVGIAIKESPYFKTFGRLNLDAQLRFAIPMMITAGEFLRVNKIEEAQFMFLIASYRPYSTIVSKWFRFGINDDKMRYVVDGLSNRFDIKKYGTVHEVLNKKSETAFDNYRGELTPPITDRNLHVIFNSGIYTRLNAMVQGIQEEYMKTGDKYMPFEKATYMGSGDSEGEELNRDIQSDAAFRSNVRRRTMTRLMQNPIDKNLLTLAAKMAFADLKREHGTYSFSDYYTDMLEGIVLSLVKEQTKELEGYLDAILSHFMANNTQTGRAKASDIKTAKFVVYSRRLIKFPNTKDENIIKMKESLKSFLENYSIDYSTSGRTKRTNIEDALNTYLILMIQKG